MDPDPATSIIPKLLLLLVLIIVNAFFAMSEIAIISLNDNKIRMMAEEGHEKAKKILKLTESPSAFLSTIQIGVTLAGFLTSASASQSFSEPLAQKLSVLFGLGSAAPSWLSAVSMVAVTIIIVSSPASEPNIISPNISSTATHTLEAIPESHLITTLLSE
mgnify:CR=1 FL=1